MLSFHLCESQFRFFIPEAGVFLESEDILISTHLKQLFKCNGSICFRIYARIKLGVCFDLAQKIPSLASVNLPVNDASKAFINLFGTSVVCDVRSLLFFKSLPDVHI